MVPSPLINGCDGCSGDGKGDGSGDGCGGGCGGGCGDGRGDGCGDGCGYGYRPLGMALLHRHGRWAPSAWPPLTPFAGATSGRYRLIAPPKRGPLQPRERMQDKCEVYSDDGDGVPSPCRPCGPSLTHTSAHGGARSSPRRGCRMRLRCLWDGPGESR
jgi:hypothetical protein